MDRVLNAFFCPIDFSDASTRLRSLTPAALARWYDAELTVLHVVPTFKPMQVGADLALPVRSSDRSGACAL